MEDQALIARAQRGDRAAFEAIVVRHQGAVYGYLRARLLHSADAEDLTQETFVRAYLARARFDNSAMLRPWLIGIARNLLREHCRRKKRLKEVAWTELCLELEEVAEPPEERYDEALTQLPRCLQSLGASAREAIDLHYHSRLRLAQIGEKLNRSEGAVKLLMYRARQALRYCLDRVRKPGDD